MVARRESFFVTIKQMPLVFRVESKSAQHGGMQYIRGKDQNNGLAVLFRSELRNWLLISQVCRQQQRCSLINVRDRSDGHSVFSTNEKRMLRESSLTF